MFTVANTANNPLAVCRVCLARNVKMYDLTDQKLYAMFKRVTRVQIDPNDKLPKILCWECVDRLSSAYSFIEKALNPFEP